MIYCANCGAKNQANATFCLRQLRGKVS
ncbi:zinc-ribbon domain-containing protein [Lactobacillus delbrueckii subsp. bulgaricus]